MADKSKNRVKEIKELKKKTKAILESDSNSNFIVDILELSESGDEALLLAFIRAARKIFTTFLSRGKLQRNLTAKSSNANFEEEDGEKEKGSEDPQDIFHHWLHEKYLVTIKRLLYLLHEDSQNIRELALCTLMKFVEGEGENDRRFPNNLFRQICDALLDKKHNMKICIERFAEYLEYDDVRFFVLKNLAKFLAAASTKCGQHLVQNAFAMLNQLKNKEKDEDLAHFLVNQCKIKASKSNDKEMQPSFCVLSQHKKVFSSAWLAFLALPLTSEIHKKVLLSLHSRVIPQMTDPKLLMDFLTDSYNTGGATSLLALNSLFILIHHYNLDYPEFFKKLYALFEPSVFRVKYRARFFHLVDMFLMSTHLPAYLVAAFAKRLSRLSLSAPPSGIMLIVPFVCNLIKRHPSIQVLVHWKKVRDCNFCMYPYNTKQSFPL